MAKISHPTIEDRYLLIRTMKYVEVPVTIHELDRVIEFFMECCELKQVPAWVVNISTGEILISADKIGQIVTPQQIKDQYKPKLEAL